MLNKLEIPDQLRKKIYSELEPRESIQWIGQPQPNVSQLIAHCLFVSLLVIPWIAFIIFTICEVFRFKVPDLREGFQPQYWSARPIVLCVFPVLPLLCSPFYV